MRKIASVLLTLVFALFLGACGGMQGVESLDLMNNDGEFAALNARINDLQNQIDLLSGDNTVVSQTLVFLQTQINDLAAELEALRTQVNVDNVTIDNRLTELETIVADLESRLNVLEAASAPVANPPMFVSADRGPGGRGATIRWTGSSGGGSIVSYNVWAVTVDAHGFFGIPMKLANGTGSSYYWDGHTENLPGEPFVGVNPSPLSAVRLLCVETEHPAKYRFAVTAIDSQGRESSPSVTADEFLVTATRVD